MTGINNLLADICCSCTLPDYCIVVRFSGFWIPYNCGFSLISNSYACDFLWANITFLHCSFDYFLCLLPDFHRIMFHPARFGVDLFVLFINRRYYFTTLIKNHASGTCGPLINRCCILFLRHFLSFFYYF